MILLAELCIQQQSRLSVVILYTNRNDIPPFNNFLPFKVNL